MLPQCLKWEEMERRQTGKFRGYDGVSALLPTTENGQSKSRLLTVRGFHSCDIVNGRTEKDIHFFLLRDLTEHTGGIRTKSEWVFHDQDISTHTVARSWLPVTPEDQRPPSWYLKILWFWPKTLHGSIPGRSGLWILGCRRG